MASAIFVHVLTGVGKLLNDCCDFFNCVLDEKKRIVTNKDEAAVHDKYLQIITLYNFLWKNYSHAIVNLDQNFAVVNKMVNKIYGAIEKDQDTDSDDPQLFSIVRWGMQLWHRKVYKKVYKSLEKAVKLQVKHYH